MLFKKYHIPLIRSGRKTETRRSKKPRVIVGNLYKPRTHFLRKERNGYIKVHAVWRERLGNITEAGAKREGYSSREEYFKIYKDIYGTRDLRKGVWAVRFSWQKTKTSR